MKTEQRRFLKKVMKNLNCLTLRELANRMDFNYSTLKNYFSEKRLLPEDFFNDLCYISQINKDSLNFKLLPKNFGQVAGGRALRKV